MKPIDQYTDDELHAVLAQRAKERLEKARKEHDVYEARVREVLTQEVIDAICPEHSRTSCSDKDVCNGWYSREDEGPRCTRCALLETHGNGVIPYPHRFTVEVR